MFIKNCINFTERCDLNVFNDCIESVFIECPSDGHKSVIYGCVYRPPNTPMNAFLDLFTTIIETIIVKEKKLCYIAGDFNIDILKYDSHPLTQSFVDVLLSLSLIPLINRPTRISNAKASLIDNIFTNNVSHDLFLNGILKSDISDHFPVFHICCDQTVCNTKGKLIQKRLMNAKNQNIFYNSLKGVNWQNVLACNDAQEAYTCFIDIFTPLYNKAFPMKTIKLHKERVVKKWLNDDLIKMIKQKYIYKIL